MKQLQTDLSNDALLISLIHYYDSDDGKYFYSLSLCMREYRNKNNIVYLEQMNACKYNIDR